MDELELFPRPPAVIHVDLTYVEGAGWHAGVISRMPGQEWPDCRRTHYDCLTTQEMLDVVWADIATRTSVS